jgi:polyhydroxyalkanoate synthesis regulator phasin
MKLGELSSAVEMMTDMWRRQEEVANAGRKALHEKVEMVRQELGLQVAGLSIRVDRLTDQVKDIEPAIKTLKSDVREFEDEAMRIEGAQRLKKYLWAAVGSGIGILSWGLHELIGYLKH